MSQQLVNHVVRPELTKSFYDPLDLLDYELAWEGRRLVPNTIRFEGELEVLQNGASLVAEDIAFSSECGINCVIDSIVTNFANTGQIENLGNYSRMVSMVANAVNSKDDMCNSNQASELRSPDRKFSKRLLKGNKNPATGSVYTEDIDFSCKPMFCLNRVSAVNGGDDTISFNKTGPCRVSIQLARVFDAFDGADCGATTSYKIKNPKLTYVSVPETNNKNNISIRVEHTIKQSINSAHAIISTKVPAVANGCSVSFQPSNNESTGVNNNQRQYELPNVKELTFLWNNAVNQQVTYTIRDRVELLQQYLDSMKNSGGHNTAHLQMLKANKSWGVGLDFKGFSDLSKKAFNIQMETGILNSNPFVAYLFFHALVQM